MILRRLFLALMAATILLTLSCKQEMFDEEAYKELIEKAAPFGAIDPKHTWNLTTTYTVQVKVGATESTEYVQILSYNPLLKDSVVILAEAAANAGDQVSLTFHAPVYSEVFQAAILKSDNSYLLKSFYAGEPIVNMDDGLVEASFTYDSKSYQTYTYCFEEDYPRPSKDWDYNDLVIRVQQIRPVSSDEVRLAITLAAVGADRQMGAGICMKGYKSEDVTSVNIAEGRTFDNNFNQRRLYFEDEALLQKSLKGEPVLNLFEDGHWTMSPRLRTDGAGVVRMYYNTKRAVDGKTSAQLRAKTLTYVIKFRNEQQAKDFSLEKLDVFALADFNSGRWEIHTYDYKTDGVLRDYGDNETAKSNHYVWALKIPTGAFRWPLEGTGMGYYRDGILTGAYMTDGHSFGQWVADRTSCRDWFCFPTTGLVY